MNSRRILLLLIPLFAACSQKPNEAQPTLPELTYNNAPAVISGKIEGYNSEMNFPELKLEKINPILEFDADKKIVINEDGTFRKEIVTGLPMLTTLKPWGTRVFLVPGNETTVTIDAVSMSEADKTPDISVENKWLSNKESQAITGILKNSFSYDRAFLEVDGMSPEDFLNWIQGVNNEAAGRLDSAGITGNARVLAEAELRNMSVIYAILYRDLVEEAYFTVRNIPYEERPNHDVNPPVPDDTYYKELVQRFFSESIAYSSQFGRAADYLLDYLVLDNPENKDKTNEEKLSMFSKDIAGLTTTNTSLLQEITRARMQAQRLEEGDFLSDEEKQSLKTTFSNKAIAEFLITQNDEIKTFIESNQAATIEGVVINQVPDVDQNKVLSTIIEKYKGKVVLVDFWATWCGPCMRAMEAMKPVKAQYKGKDVVFVYLTGETSPIGAWNKTIPDIKGEHYRVTASQWRYWYKELGIEGVPTFMVFDRKGKFTAKYTGFPGAEEIEASINANL